MATPIESAGRSCGHADCGRKRKLQELRRRRPRGEFGSRGGRGGAGPLAWRRVPLHPRRLSRARGGLGAVAAAPAAFPCGKVTAAVASTALPLSRARWPGRFANSANSGISALTLAFIVHRAVTYDDVIRTIQGVFQVTVECGCVMDTYTIRPFQRCVSESIKIVNEGRPSPVLPNMQHEFIHRKEELRMPMKEFVKNMSSKRLVSSLYQSSERPKRLRCRRAQPPSPASPCRRRVCVAAVNLDDSSPPLCDRPITSLGLVNNMYKAQARKGERLPHNPQHVACVKRCLLCDMIEWDAGWRLSPFVSRRGDGTVTTCEDRSFSKNS
ncbi:Protein of unknown function [Gryllus bimaculatus]|nr:Protein of unknown function [Gryllus bimaculatus]